MSASKALWGRRGAVWVVLRKTVVPWRGPFLAKAVWDLPTTRHLIDRLGADPALRRLCGWSRLGAIPSEATFSRAFAEFAEARLAERMHEALVVEVLGETLIGHVSRDSTAIEGREAAGAKVKVKTPKRRPGRPRKGEERPKIPSRLERPGGRHEPQGDARRPPEGL